MRFDVHKVRTYLINEFNEATETVARINHDGSDVIILELFTGETVIVHLVERLMPVIEIRDTLTEDTAANMHTLFVLWSDMLLPVEEQIYQPEDWMELLLTLYQGKIYGYDSYGPYATVFPVQFEKTGLRGEYFVSYGDAIKASQLGCRYVHVDTPYLSGRWRLADFSSVTGPGSGQNRRRGGGLSNYQRHALAEYYAVLDIPTDSDRGAVRQAYYQLARLHHPDINNSPDSTHRMQAINEAYQRIMEQFEKDS